MTGHSKAERFLGFHWQIGVATKGVVKTNGTDKVEFGPKPPALITHSRLVLAGALDPATIISDIRRSHAKHNHAHLTMDREYTRTPDIPLAARRAGLPIAIDLYEPQRGRRPLVTGADLVDGHPMSSFPPDDLNDLSRETDKHEDKYHIRAAFRFGYSEHCGGGAFRMQDPFKRMTLATPHLPKTLEGSRRKPPRLMHATEQELEDKRLAAIWFDADAAPHVQMALFGTDAHRIVYSTRLIVEKGIAEIREHADLDPKYQRSFSYSRRQRWHAHQAAAHNYREMK